MNKRIGILAAIIVVLVAAVLFKKSPEPHPVRITMPEMPRSAPVVPHETKTNDGPHQAVDTPTPETASTKDVGDTVAISDKIKAMRLTTLQEYRDDNRADPHRPSERLIKAVLALDDLRGSVKSENEARQVVGYYKDCLNSDTPTSLKVTCYRYSRELAQRFPGVAGQVAALDSGLNADVRRILDRTKRE